MNTLVDMQLTSRESKSLLIVLACLKDYEDYATYLEWIRNDLESIRLKLEMIEVDFKDNVI